MLTYGKITRLTTIFLAVGLVMAGLLLGIGWARASGTAVTAQTTAAAAGTAFTYQGRLVYNGTAVDGACNLTFKLYDAASSGTQIGSNVAKSSVPVGDGFFSIDLDFGSGAFTGDGRYLQITIDSCTNGASNATLSPLIELKPAPYAIYAASAPWSGLSGVPAGLPVYTRTIIVSPIGTESQNGAALLDAVNSITGTTSFANPYLIKIEPGTYALGSDSLQIPPYTHVEGSGQNATFITGSSNSSPMYKGVVEGATFAELRNLTVSATGSNNNAISVYNASAIFTLRNVMLNASGSSGLNIGASHTGNGSLLIYNSSIFADGNLSSASAYGVLGQGGYLEIYDSYITAQSGSSGSINLSAIGIAVGGVGGIPTSLTLTGGRTEAMGNGAYHTGVWYVTDGSSTPQVKIFNAEITASFATAAATAVDTAFTSGAPLDTLEINNSRLNGNSFSLRNKGHIVNVGASQLTGAIEAPSSGGAYNCVYVYDGSYNTTTCP